MKINVKCPSCGFEIKQTRMANRGKIPDLKIGCCSVCGEFLVLESPTIVRLADLNDLMTQGPRWHARMREVQIKIKLNR